MKLFVSNLATIGGITIAEAMRVTPSTCRETTIVAARIKEKPASTHPVGIP